jgi:hypothetical protein
MQELCSWKMLYWSKSLPRNLIYGKLQCSNWLQWWTLRFYCYALHSYIDLFLLGDYTTGWMTGVQFPAVAGIVPPCQCVQTTVVKWLAWTDHSFPPAADIKNKWCYTSTYPYVFMAQCLAKHRTILPLPLQCGNNTPSGCWYLRSDN